MTKSRWHQDKEVLELIVHLNQPEKYDNWSALSESEYRAIENEIRHCRKDFIYASRNYFWISNKQLGDQLFSLWPTQELILEKLLEIKAKGLPQKLLIIKARQLGCSTLIEALIAWRTMFFQNVNALVVSTDREHAADVLYPIMQIILDRMPWWLQPATAMRKADSGLWFTNPDESARKIDPGQNSRVYVKGATSTTGVGQGIRLSAVHYSEFADSPDEVAKSIIDEDMVNALVETADTFAILESTAKGANRYAHRLWKRNVELAEECEWWPLFFPWFFEASRTRIVMPGWRIEEHERLMRERIERDWVACNHPECKQFHNRYIHTFDRSGIICPTCETGTLSPYILTDEQAAWMQHRRKNAAKDEESTKKLAQEMASTAEESFQISGYQIFGGHAQEWVNSTVRSPIYEGFFDPVGNFHACNMNSAQRNETRCFAPCIHSGCQQNHWWDEKPLLIWEMPVAGENYVCGADVAEGLGGKADSSVGTVLRLANRAGAADYQVATWRSNRTDPIQFAYELNFLGRMYNDALMSIELNRYDTTGTYIRFQLQYPNLYRWKHPDSMNVLSNKLGWVTNVASRPRLWQHFKRWCDAHLIYVRSRNAVEEMKNFIKDDYDDTRAGGDHDEHDDEAMALMISLYTGHECEYSDTLGLIPVRTEVTPETAKLKMKCVTCGHEYFNNDLPFTFPEPEAGVIKPPDRCPQCSSLCISILRNLEIGASKSLDPDYDLLDGEHEVSVAGDHDYRNW